MIKSHIFKNLNSRRKADGNFRGNLVENHYKNGRVMALLTDVSLLKRKKVYQNSFLNVYTFNIKKKLQMISFLEESFNYEINAEYR